MKQGKVFIMFAKSCFHLASAKIQLSFLGHVKLNIEKFELEKDIYEYGTSVPNSYT